MTAFSITLSKDDRLNLRDVLAEIYTDPIGGINPAATYDDQTGVLTFEFVDDGEGDRKYLTAKLSDMDTDDPKLEY